MGFLSLKNRCGHVCWQPPKNRQPGLSTGVWLLATLVGLSGVCCATSLAVTVVAGDCQLRVLQRARPCVAHTLWTPSVPYYGSALGGVGLPALRRVRLGARRFGAVLENLQDAWHPRSPTTPLPQQLSG